MPPAALANDMMIFYAPRELYTKKVTIMEMICASVCLTSMICFSLEKNIGGNVRSTSKFICRITVWLHEEVRHLSHCLGKIC